MKLNGTVGHYQGTNRSIDSRSRSL